MLLFRAGGLNQISLPPLPRASKEDSTPAALAPLEPREICPQRPRVPRPCANAVTSSSHPAPGTIEPCWHLPPASAEPGLPQQRRDPSPARARRAAGPWWRVTRPPPGRAGTLPSSPSPHPGAAAQGLYLFRSSCLCSSLCRCSCGCHCWAGSSLGSHTGWRSTGRWLQGGSKTEALTASDTPASAAAQGCSCVLLPPSPVLLPPSPVSQW